MYIPFYLESEWNIAKRLMNSYNIFVVKVSNECYYYLSFSQKIGIFMNNILLSIV